MIILRRADVATKLGIHPVTLDTWVKEDRFVKPFYLTANRPVWDEEDVTSWLKLKKQTGEADGTSSNETQGVRPT